MRLRELLVEAIKPPVTYEQVVTPEYEQVVTPEWIDEVLDYGFDTGEPHPDANPDIHGGTRFDWQSMLRMLVELRDRGVIPEDVDIHDDQSLAKPYLTHWWKRRFEYVLSWIEADRVGDGYRIHREMRVSDDTAQRLARTAAPLGTFWSFSRGEAFWGREELGSMKLQAVVAEGDIDWITTIRRNMNYVIGEDEMEVSLRSGTPITLVSMRYRGKPLPFQFPERTA